jgi:flagellar export protein FliJ
MKPFRFRLATVLRLRNAARDERRSELGRALRAAEVLREQQGKVAAELVENQDAARRLMQQQAASSAGVNVDSLLNTNRHALVLKAQLAQLGKQQQQIAAEIAKRQAALVEADRDVRVLEKLQEKQQAEHEQRSLALEQRELDEIAVLHAFRAREAAV